MFDQSYGLRFDIYERINLTEDLPGIEELEEAELIPHIQVISQQDQATLRGHLLLAGLYKGDTEAGETEPLEHWIPVEITVPMNRVSSLDDIAVEIENFDVDLLSKRALNITGFCRSKEFRRRLREPATKYGPMRNSQWYMLLKRLICIRTGSGSSRPTRTTSFMARNSSRR